MSGTVHDGRAGRACADVGLLLMGHGTKSRAGVEQCRQLAGEVTLRAGDIPVSLGFIEIAAPGLQLAIDELVRGGCRSIVGVPLVLLGAGHLKLDGPSALAEGRARNPAVGFTYGRDLGIHPTVLEVAEERIRSAQRRLGADPAVVLVGRGSTDPDANSDLYKVARLLSDSRGLGTVEPAFVSLAGPSVPEALDRCLALGATRIAVVPYFLFTGQLVEKIGDQTTDWARSHPGTWAAVGSELGPDGRLAGLVLERFAEARDGGAFMNCDCCVYRTPLPGYEERAPVHGHSAGADRLQL